MSAPMPSGVDSRRYIVSLDLHSAGDCPADFGIAPIETFDAGVFLPGDPPNWFGRSAYPARILILARGELFVFAHPKESDSLRRTPLRDLTFLEVGHILLLGWLRFASPAGDWSLPFNTRNRPAVDRFLGRLRADWLPFAPSAVEPPRPAGLELKFEYALSRELDAGEEICASFFNPPTPGRRKRLALRRGSTIPGDLIALTPRRVLWITDRYRNGFERYGTVARYAPASSIASMACTRAADRCALRIDFRAAEPWTIPLPPEMRDQAETFVGQSHAFKTSIPHPLNNHTPG
jgi:hypothetical protein